MSKCVDWHKVPFGGLEYMGCKFMAVLPQNRQKFPPEMGFPMLNLKSNYARIVTHRQVIPSANPTMSGTANPTKVTLLTLN